MRGAQKSSKMVDHMQRSPWMMASWFAAEAHAGEKETM